MNYRTNKLKFLFLMLMIFLLKPNLTECADYEKYYFGISMPYMSILGKDFKGDTAQVTGPVLISVPKWDGNIGFGAFFMYRIRNIGYEFSYQNISHKASLPDPREDALGNIEDRSTNHMFYFNLRFFKPIFQGLELFGLVGANYSLHRVNNSYFESEIYETPGTDNAVGVRWNLISHVILNGFGINLGGGVNFILGSGLGLSLEAVVHPDLYTSARIRVKEIYGDVKVNYKLDNMLWFGLGACLTLTYSFPN
jgi:hypothetical protein